MGRLGRHLVSLLEGLVVDEGQRPLGALSLFAPSERQQLLLEWNDWKIDYPRHEGIAALFEVTVQQRPDAVVLNDGAFHLSRSTLDRRANRLAQHLLSLEGAGIGRGARLVLLLERSPEFMVAVLATLKVGGAYVPLATDYPEDRLSFMIADAGLTALLTEAPHAETLPSLELPRVVLDQEAEAIAGRATEAPPHVAGGGDLGLCDLHLGLHRSPQGGGRASAGGDSTGVGYQLRLPQRRHGHHPLGTSVLRLPPPSKSGPPCWWVDAW